MGRQRTINITLPPRMDAYKGKRRTTYYYLPSTGDRKRINLGHDKDTALLKWAQLETCAQLAPESLDSVWVKYCKDILPHKKASTQKGNINQFKSLSAVFGAMPLESIKPHHVKRYLLDRSAPVMANREKALLSHVFNYARETGLTDAPNPCAGMSRNKEHARTRYIENDEFLAVYRCAEPAIRDAMALLLYTGLRPVDALKLSRLHIKGDVLEFGATQKTGAALRMEITPAFNRILKRALNRRPDLGTFFLIAQKNGQPLTRHMLEGGIKRAQAKAGVEFQIRDIRAKSASDAASTDEAKARLLHSDYAMTQKYIRSRKADIVKPLK